MSRTGGRINRIEAGHFAKPVLIWLLLAVPLVVFKTAFGHDMAYHLMRIEALSEELKNGVFPVRMESLFFGGLCYPSAIYYNDLFLYVPAILRLCGVSVFGTYIVYVLIVHAASTGIAYHSFSRMFCSRTIGAVLALCYVTSFYRLMNIYVRAAVGEYTAYAFFPLIAYALQAIYQDEHTDLKCSLKKAARLAVGLTGVCSCHVISAEMVVLTMVLVALLLIKKTLSKRVILPCALAAVWTLLMNAWYLVPLADYYVNVDANINHDIGSASDIQALGASVRQYFSFFRSPYGYSSEVVAARMQLTIGPVLLTALLAGVLLWVTGHFSKEGCLYTVLTLLFLWISSDLFPWAKIQKVPVLSNLLCAVQFPWRYLGMASLFAALVLGSVLRLFCESEQIFRWFHRVAAGVSVIAAAAFLVFVGYSVQNAQMVYPKTRGELNTDSVGEAEYLRYGVESVIYDVRGENLLEAEIVSRKGCSLVVSCRAGGESGSLTIPIFCYKGFEVTDETGAQYVISDSPEKMIQVSVPAGFDGNLYVRFVEPVYWRVAEIVSLFALIGILAIMLTF